MRIGRLRRKWIWCSCWTLRRTPRLRFAYDESFDKGARIEQLLAEHEPMPDYIPDPDGDGDAAPGGDSPAGSQDEA